MAFGIGGSKNKSKNEYSSNSTFNQNVDATQNPALENLYGQAGDLYNSEKGYADTGKGMVPGMTDQMTDVYNLGMGGVGNQISGGSYGDTSNMRAGLYDSIMGSMNNPSQMGRMYENIVGGPGNTYIDPMVASMKQGMNQNLTTQQNQMAGQAGAMGQGGGSRHAMQNAMLGAQANRDMTNTENQMRGNAYDTDMNWKMGIAQQADLGRGQAQQRGMDLLSGANSTVQQGMANLPGQQNLGMNQMAPWMQGGQMPWMNLQNYSNVVGPPTVLDSGTESSRGSGTSKGGSFGFSMGGK